MATNPPGDSGGSALARPPTRDVVKGPTQVAIVRRFSTGSAELNIINEAKLRDAGHFVATFAAGVGSGALSSTICAPLDLVRTRMQVWGDVGKAAAASASANSASTLRSSLKSAITDILEKEGRKGLFRGLGATLVTVPLFWGVYFPLYDETKFKVTQAYPDLHPSVIHCGSAVFTGAIADLLCNPLFVVRTRLQTQALHQRAHHQSIKQTGMLRTAAELYQANGYTIFWRGMTANLMGLSHVGVQFPTYEFLKQQARDRRNDGQPETAMELLVASALAKMSASSLTYPHEVLRSRMMDSRATVAPTLRGTMAHIWRQEGFAGFYSGLPITLIRVIPNTCITFISYEFFSRWAKDQWNQWRHQTM